MNWRNVSSKGKTYRGFLVGLAWGLDNGRIYELQIQDTNTGRKDTIPFNPPIKNCLNEEQKETIRTLMEEGKIITAKVKY